ncbi:hypothetical protein [Streptomyces sp. NPDC050504]|uniref:hypothetical protein n=1 Tax=Streptomyces sp. NPDC050504 TaxID=3365618 RepID=UPI00378F1A23
MTACPQFPADGPSTERPSTERPSTERPFIDVVAVRNDRTAPSGETTVLRLLSLLPAHWTCTPDVASDRVSLRVALDRATRPDAVRNALATVLADTALHGWQAA